MTIINIEYDNDIKQRLQCAQTKLTSNLKSKGVGYTVQRQKS